MATMEMTSKAIEARDVTVQGDLNISISQITVQSNEPGIPVNSFRIVDAPIDIFEGRQELLAKLHRQLQACSAEKHYMKRMVALVAIGGMGKTETARKLVDEYRGHYKNVAWVDAETDSSARQSFIRIAEVLRISHSKDIEGKRVAELVYRHTSQHVKGPVLFVLDNTCCLKSDGDIFGIFDYLPTQGVGDPPLILLTSQTKGWGRHCTVLDVTELNQAESWNFLRSRFKLSDEDVQGDRELQGLLENLTERLNGYPLALGLVAANISFIPGQGSMELLKRQLRRFIDCVDNQKFLEQRVDRQLGTNYKRTMSAVWEIAMENLERQEFAMEAKQLLSILAHCPQEHLRTWIVEELYKVKNATLGITFPDETDGVFEEALDALQTVGIARVERGTGRSAEQIMVHRLVQELASLGDNKKIGIQKILLNVLSNNNLVFIFLPDKYFWSDDGIPGWAIESVYTVRLWLNGLRFQLHGGRAQTIKNDDAKWKRQLKKFRDGADIAVVADFFLNNRSSSPNGSHAPCPNQLWTYMINAVKAKSLLVGKCKETGFFLELLLLSAVGNILYPFSGCPTENLIQQVGISLRLAQPQADRMLASFRKWLSEFDFTTACRHDSAKDGLISTMRTFDRFGRFCSFAGKKIQLVSTTAWLQWQNALVLPNGKLRRLTDPGCPASLVESIDLDLPDELLDIACVLDYISDALRRGDEVEFLALGMLRKLVVRPNGVKLVVQKRSLMNQLESFRVYTWRSGKPLRFMRLRSSDETKRRLPSLPEGAICPSLYPAQDTFKAYSFVTVCICLWTNLSSNEAQACRMLEELLPAKKCEDCRLLLSGANPDNRIITDMKWWLFYEYGDCQQYAYTKRELDDDQVILSLAIDWLLNGIDSGRENSWQKALFRVIRSAQRFNQLLLSWMLMLEIAVGPTDDSDDDNSNSSSSASSVDENSRRRACNFLVTFWQEVGRVLCRISCLRPQTL